ncbi:MAG: hypothetical protein GY795_21720 [Desulfobacterales bacterium]|nr:hypothetical protein [Desulfobacterales bacterium]
MKTGKKAERIVIIANKRWEADPLVNVMLHKKARPDEFHEFERLADLKAKKKLSFKCKSNGIPIEIWCLEELMDPDKSSSSTKEKWKVLPEIFDGETPPTLVIAFGTAGFPGDSIRANGCVVIGSNVFIHDPYYTKAGDQTDKWTNSELNKVINSKDILPSNALFPADGHFLMPPINPANPPRVFSGDGFYSLGVVNVTNYDDYIWADKQAIATFNEEVENKKMIGSVETTHGLIKLQAGEAPFLFVSGIANTVGHFNLEVTPRVYSQNFVAAHNAGIALAWLLPHLCYRIKDGQI